MAFDGQPQGNGYQNNPGQVGYDQAGQGQRGYQQQPLYRQEQYQQTGYGQTGYQASRPQAPYMQAAYGPAGSQATGYTGGAVNTDASYTRDHAERISMARAYGEMAVGLVVTAAVAYLSAASGLLLRFLMATGRLGWIGIMIVQVVFAVSLSAKVMTMKPSTARVMFYLYAALMGFTLSTIFMTYSVPGIFLALLISAGFFFVLSMLSLTTRKNMLGLGSIFMVALLALIAVEVVLLFVAPSNTTLMLVAALSIVLFAGLTIYDAQQTRAIFEAYAGQGTEVIERVSILCALNLYLDFVNLFVYILQLVGQRD